MQHKMTKKLKKKGKKMIAIGNVKLGKRIEPIYVQELSREEANRILQSQGINFDENSNCPIDTRIVNVFRTDKQKLAEYIQVCKYVFDRKCGREREKLEVSEFSIFDNELQINYELRHLKESEVMEESEKIKIYRQAKEMQSLFKVFGANNVRLEINLLDRAYFEIQSFIHTIRTKGKVKVLTEGKTKEIKSGEFRKQLFDEEAKEATERMAKTWEENPRSIPEKEEVSKY